MDIQTILLVGELAIIALVVLHVYRRCDGGLDELSKKDLRRSFINAGIHIGLAALFAGNWDGLWGTTSLLHSRLFAMGAFATIAAIYLTYALKPLWSSLGPTLIARCKLVLAVYVGLAIGTTEWGSILDQLVNNFGFVKLASTIGPLIWLWFISDDIRAAGQSEDETRTISPTAPLHRS